MAFGPPLHIVDNFIGGAGVADDEIGEFDWELTAVGNGSTLAYGTAEDGASNGFIRDTTAVTADGDGAAYHSTADSFSFNNKGGYCKFRARYPDITGNQLAGNNFRIGADDSVTAADPDDGIVVTSDAGVLSLKAFSGGNGDVTATVAGVSTLTSGTTMVLGTWHDFEFRWSGDNGNAAPGPDYVVLYIDGEKAAELSGVTIDSAEACELKIIHWQDSGSGATLELDVDYFEFFQAR